ncbi:integrase core domain-containing protein [Iodobacter arcticus]|uniref:Integrase core domain-containing protein n=1 Tax=Iodobacter arcticus TaxID=590593 RepID=A0ABW2QVM7_9NEIS
MFFNQNDGVIRQSSQLKQNQREMVLWLACDDFASIAEVQETATQWLWIYNNERPHMGLGGITAKQKLALHA